MYPLKDKSAAIRILDRLFLPVEKVGKQVVFDCRMCGQCILHETGLTCPMRCPKNERNGPCGGVRPNGNCEVFPDKPCVWVQGIERAQRLPLWRRHIHHLQPPVDWRLKDTSSWTNLLTGRDRFRPKAWGAASPQTEPAPFDASVRGENAHELDNGNK
jgi:hypothetical protein